MLKIKSLEKPLKLLYLFGLLLLVGSIPFSFYFTSISLFFLVTVWLVGFFVFPYKDRLKQNKEVLCFLLIFIIHIIWLWNTENFDYAFTDIRKKLSLFVLPLIIASMPPIGFNQRNIILNFLFIVMLASGIIVFLAAGGFIGNAGHDPRTYSLFVNHIRLALLIVLTIFISAWYVKNSSQFSLKIIYTLNIVFNLAVLVVLQALTGIIIALICLYIISLIRLHLVNSKRIKRIISVALLIIPLLSAAYLTIQVRNFYIPEKPYPENKNIKTKRGNPYNHSNKTRYIENGNYVYQFVCWHELAKTWNKRSNIKFDSLDNSQHKVKNTLLRYLTSKGELKDAESVNNLSAEEVKAIENGLTNYRFKDKKGLNPRIYKIIWQLHAYSHGSNPSGKTLAQRLVYLKTGWKIASNKLITGVGTGDVNDKYMEQYRLDKTTLKPDFRRRSHNQYLSILIATGIFGLFIFLMAWIMPAIKKEGFKKYFFTVIFIISSLSMLTEDTLETLTGSVFIAFYYSLFLWGLNYKSMYQEKFMKKAIKLAKDNIPSGNGPFGAVIVKNNEIIAETANSVTKNNDPTAHAEVNAIRKACEKLKTFDLSGCEIYSSCEPCPMCLGAIYWARLDKLYFASTRKDAAKAGFSDEFIYEELNKNIETRSIQTRNIMNKEGKVVFDNWNEFEDKIMY